MMINQNSKHVSDVVSIPFDIRKINVILLNTSTELGFSTNFINYVFKVFYRLEKNNNITSMIEKLYLCIS